jgi:hypothetical protein
MNKSCIRKYTPPYIVIPIPIPRKIIEENAAQIEKETIASIAKKMKKVSFLSKNESWISCT